MTEEQVKRHTHSAVCEVFQIDLPDQGKKPDYDLAGEYEVDCFMNRIRRNDPENQQFQI